MSAQPVQPFVTPEEYLRIERAAEFRSEFISGEMIAMSGASNEHEMIVVNLAATAHSALRGKPCRTRGSNMRVRVRSTSYLYPDLTVVCGKLETLDDAYLDTILNPTAIFEILSDSTEFIDRGIKWQLYQKIESLKHYVLVSQNVPRVEVYTRQSDTDWLVHVEEGLDGRVALQSLGITLSMVDIYEDIDMDPSVADTQTP